jgi:hypothetical protein
MLWLYIALVCLLALPVNCGLSRAAQHVDVQGAQQARDDLTEPGCCMSA